MDAATRWIRVRALFEQALAQPADTRSAWLAAQPDDEALKAEVATLLAGAATTGPGMSPSLPPLPDWATAAHDMLGAWRLVERIGAGGMGEVWRAQRADGRFDAEAAVKLLRPGLDADAFARRFAQEQRSLAQMQHPHIARLLDAGVSPSGRPYLVMEFVRGRPIDEAAQDLGERGRIGLFLQLADAVAHAHRKLVVHRDIKPGNVLVDAQGQVKLLDFGIAKALDPQQADGAAEQTLFEQRPFTPAFASPEQVQGEPISTATDIYSLGVLLYRLLTGQPPYARGTTTPAEMARAVVIETPVRPDLPPDLANILLKAMAKPVDERYASVDAFADDLRRYLGGYPVRARPPTRAGRAAKFVRRNPLATALSTLSLASVLGGAGVALWQAEKAEQRLASVKRITKDAVFRFGDAVTYVPGGMAIKADLLQQMVGTLDELVAVSAGDAELRATAAMAYAKLADVEFNDNSASLQRRAQAKAHAARALALAHDLLAQRLSDTEFVVWTVRAVESSARAERAEGQVAQGLGTLNPVLPLLEHAVQRLPADARGDRRALQVEHARAEHLRAQFLFRTSGTHLNRVDDALADLAHARDELAALEAEEHHAEIVYLQGSVDGAESSIRSARGEVATAVRLARSALDRREAVVKELPDDVEYRDALVTEAINAGRILLKAGDVPGALAASTRGWQMNETLKREHASDANNAWARRLPALAPHHARVLLAAGHRDEARAVVTAGLAAATVQELREPLLAVQAQMQAGTQAGVQAEVQAQVQAQVQARR